MEGILAIASGVSLLVGGFLLWYPTIKPEVGAGSRGGRVEEWEKKQRMKSNRPNLGRLGEYPWTDKLFYTEAWVLLIIGTALGILSFYR
jgi:hypothetical protein